MGGLVPLICATERVWAVTSHWPDKHLDDNLGGHYVVSICFQSISCHRLEAERSVRNRTLLNGLQNGGPAGLIYGYLFVWLGATLQALVMAEMASMYVRATAISLSFSKPRFNYIDCTRIFKIPVAVPLALHPIGHCSISALD